MTGEAVDGRVAVPCSRAAEVVLISYGQLLWIGVPAPVSSQLDKYSLK